MCETRVAAAPNHTRFPLKMTRGPSRHLSVRNTNAVPPTQPRHDRSVDAQPVLHEPAARPSPTLIQPVYMIAGNQPNSPTPDGNTHVHRLSVECSCLPSALSASDRTAGSTVMPCPHGLRTVNSWAATRASCIQWRNVSNISKIAEEGASGA